MPHTIIAAAERRAQHLGIGADEVLISQGAISEDDYIAALAAWLGTKVDPLDFATRIACPHSERQLLAAMHGPLPLRDGPRTKWLFAPRGLKARELIRFLSVRREFTAPPRLVAPDRLRRFVLHHAGETFGRLVADALKIEHPELSAADDRPLRVRALAGASGLLAILATTIASGFFEPTAALLSTAFLAWVLLRFACVFITPPRYRRQHIPHDRLPVYTVIVALYREARAVPDLIAALSAFDYPAEKLDIKLALEKDDWETRDAIARLHLPQHFEVVIAPPIGPRTKPKALNAALALARGQYVVVYDAEDRPPKDQLLRALDAFEAEDKTLACVQARLTIDNLNKNAVVTSFFAEYAAQFDVLLPAMARLQLPLLLGGTSNHFRIDALRQVGAWDAYNVTEDADLGVRLARRGYRATVIASTTTEEAPERISPWLHQRTRWFKGWMQTWQVHMRAPHRLFADLGPIGFLAFQLTLGGSILSALIYPWFLLQCAVGLVRLFSTPGGDDDLGSPAMLLLHFGSIGGGIAVSSVLMMRGLLRRAAPQHAWILLLMPLHWLMLSCAAWRAAYQVVCDPHSWEKTEHGVAQRPRLR